MSSPFFGEDSERALLQSTSDNMSDSGNFDAVLELLAKGSERSLPECVMMMIPEAWQDNPSLSDSKRSFYEYNSCLMEPWDGNNIEQPSTHSHQYPPPQYPSLHLLLM